MSYQFMSPAWSIVMAGTCSAAGPKIVESCIDPDTGEPWEREVAKLPCTHLETRDAHMSPDMPGTFNTHPERFGLINSGHEFAADEVCAIAAQLAAAPLMVEAIGKVLECFAYAPGTGPDWFEACRAAHAAATTPYVPTPDAKRD